MVSILNQIGKIQKAGRSAYRCLPESASLMLMTATEIPSFRAKTPLKLKEEVEGNGQLRTKGWVGNLTAVWLFLA